MQTQKTHIFLQEKFPLTAGIPAIVVPRELYIAVDSEKIKISVFDSLDMLVIAWNGIWGRIREDFRSISYFAFQQIKIRDMAE